MTDITSVHHVPRQPSGMSRDTTDTLQRYLNLHFSVSLDLFGAEASTNAANYFAAGLKGRFQETERADDHRLHDALIEVPVFAGGTIGTREVPALSALNATLQSDYVDDCQKGVERWNRTLEPVGGSLQLPHPGFHREVGVFAGHRITPDGRAVSEADWEAARSQWLPTDDDRRHVVSLMTPVTDPGRMAGWIAPPSAGINQRPVDFEYVRVA